MKIFRKAKKKSPVSPGSRIARQQIAFEKSLELCRIWGLYWRDNVIPIKESDEIIGYYVIDETQSTTVGIIYI